MATCRLCKGKNLLKILDFGNHPIAHHLLENPEEKEYTHPVAFHFCRHCGLIQITNPVPPERFYTNYFSLTSWKNQPHIPQTIDYMEKMPGINKNSRIIEAGSNDGIFLQQLEERGYGNYLGIEPALDAYNAAMKKGLKTINTYFNKNSAREIIKEQGKFDVFINRQVIEHIENLDEFKDSMKMVLSENGIVVFEIPDFLGNLNYPDYANWEEHINCFTKDSFQYFLNSAGVRILHVEPVTFSGDSLIMYGIYDGEEKAHDADYMRDLEPAAMRYGTIWPEFRKDIVEFLEKCGSGKRKIAIYGAGARTCAFINYLGIAEYVSFIVDDQPEKQNKFLPGSKLGIFPSDMIEKEKIDICLLGVTTENEEKVIAKHKQFADRGGIFYSILPPSGRLLPPWNKYARLKV